MDYENLHRALFFIHVLVLFLVPKLSSQRPTPENTKIFFSLTVYWYGICAFEHKITYVITIDIQ
jgi:hypothetical protein